MLLLLDKNKQCSITLGDYYQNLSGGAHRRAGTVRGRSITHSFRAGGPIEQVVNPIIWAHPSGPKDEFHGNSEVHTEIEYYTEARLPDEPTVILVSDEWSLWEWAQRVAEKNQRFRLISPLNDLNTFVSDVIELKEHGTRPRHRRLFGYQSWDELVANHQISVGSNTFWRVLTGVTGTTIGHTLYVFIVTEITISTLLEKQKMLETSNAIS